MPLTWTAVLDELRRADLLSSAPAAAPDPAGIGVDSRTIERGMLYIAVRGSQSDGHRFVGQAVSRGAGAVVVEASDDDRIGIIDFENYVDGSGGDALCMPAGGSKRPATHETVDQRLHYVKQDGAAVFKWAVRNTEEAAKRILDRNGVKPCEIDLFVSHQANRRIIQSATQKLGIPPEKVVINIERFGNTTAGTIPLALNDAVEEKRLKEGDLLLLASVGAGFTVGTVLMRWGLKQ